MQSLILESVGSLCLRELPLPDVKPGEILLKVKAATTCGTDLKAFLRGHPMIPMPGPLGHEYSGIVEVAGEGAKFKIGDPVMGVHSAPCQRCYWCHIGQENLCESIMETKILGSFSEYLLIPKRIAALNLFPKPAEISFEIASLLEPLACVAQGILSLRQVGSLPCESALVIGPGAIGLMFCIALKMDGVQKVVLAGRNPERLEIGKSYGAEVVKWSELQPQSNPGFDCVVECTGQVEVWEKCVDFPRRGGVAMLFGGPPSGSNVRFDTGRLHYNQITLLSPFHFGTQAVQLATSWLSDPRIDFSRLISASRSLEEADQVFSDLREGRGIKYAFVP